VNKPREWVTTR